MKLECEQNEQMDEAVAATPDHCRIALVFGATVLAAIVDMEEQKN